MKNLSKLTTFEQHKTELMKDPKFKKEYEVLRPKYEAINAIIKARLDSGLTQAELAKKLKTKQSNISRLESGKVSPSLSFLQKVAKVFNKQLEVKFT